MKESKKNGKSENELGKWIIIVVVILVILTTVLNVLSSKNENDDTTEVSISNNNSSTGKKVNVLSIDIEKLRNMNERDRMEYYFSYWLRLIEEREYEEAYEILYPEFRENYFNTLGKFENYVINTFPRMAGLTYTNIERNGHIYVLWVEIADTLNGNKDEKVSLNVVIKENDFANIEMSFSVI